MGEREMKVVFIGNMAAPYMVKLCYSMQSFHNTEFWFYEHIKKSRPSWWEIPLGEKCKLINHSFSYRDKYVSFSLNQMLREFDPDVVLLGFFAIPSNYLAYLWAKRNNKKVILVSEYWRSSTGKTRDSRFLTSIIRWAYKDLNGVFGMGDHAAEYFKNEIGFSEDKIFPLTYPMDICSYYKHELRRKKNAYTYIFSHRLDDNYNPLLALEIFLEIQGKYSGSKLRLNSSGPLKQKCENWIKEHNLEKVISFIDEVQSWDDLHLVYKECDISISPATYSNGNISIVEAMASGLGIVMSDRIRFNDKLISESNGGFICKPNKFKFVEAIEQYILNPELLSIHGIRNRNVVKRLSTKEVAKSWAEAIDRVFLVD